jgi:hypothetical protein
MSAPRVPETLLVTWDWGEAFVALQLALKPALDELFMTHLGRLARAAGGDVLERTIFSFNEDCAWHPGWSRPLVQVAIRDTPDAATAVEAWIEPWAPRVRHTISRFRPVFEEMPVGRARLEFESVLDEIDRFGRQQCTSALAR